MNLEQFQPQEPAQEKVLPLAEHNAIQKALVEEFRMAHGIAESEKNESALNWIANFAGPFRQLSMSEDGVRLIEMYKNAGDEKEKEFALNALQKSLERLSQPN